MRESESQSSSRSARLNDLPGSGICNERILILVFDRLQWDIQTLCRTASVSRRLRALAKRLLWRELCFRRAARLATSLTDRQVDWRALAKLLFFCGGPTAGARHFVRAVRFSKTSGRSFLGRGCGGDVLYVSDPCEHVEDVGVYRGVFRSFRKSRTREFLIRKRAGFEDGVGCPYCGGRVWSVSAGRSAARRLGSRDEKPEYFVCINGHMHGTCWLVHLSSDEDGDFTDSWDSHYFRSIFFEPQS